MRHVLRFSYTGRNKVAVHRWLGEEDWVCTPDEARKMTLEEALRERARRGGEVEEVL